jgi:uncharacterized protein CbrC (UPF0167 family)
MRNEMNEITCQTCGTTASKYITGTTIQRMYLDGERYYGYPLKQGSIIVNGNSCGNCVRAQGTNRNSVVATGTMSARTLTVNEMP